MRSARSITILRTGMRGPQYSSFVLTPQSVCVTVGGRFQAIRIQHRAGSVQASPSDRASCGGPTTASGTRDGTSVSERVCFTDKQEDNHSDTGSERSRPYPVSGTVGSSRCHGNRTQICTAQRSRNQSGTIMGPRMTRTHPQMTPTDPRIARIHTDKREAFQER